jgi:hypothetical protein
MLHYVDGLIVLEVLKDFTFLTYWTPPSSEPLLTIYPAIPRHIPKDLNIQHNICDKLKSRPFTIPSRGDSRTLPQI